MGQFVKSSTFFKSDVVRVRALCIIYPFLPFTNIPPCRNFLISNLDENVHTALYEYLSKTFFGRSFLSLDVFGFHPRTKGFLRSNLEARMDQAFSIT